MIQAAGAKWKNDQYGVGVSFWSEDSSLAEKIGLKSLEKSLMQWSNRYSKVFWAPSNNPYVLQQPQSIIHNGSNNAQEQEKTKETPRSEPFPDYRVIR